jgi:hypothetical protein
MIDQTAIDQLGVVITAAAATLSAVPNVGFVHPYKRAANSEAKFKELFVKDKAILGWMFSRESTSAQDTGVHFCEEEHTLLLRGYMGVQDADDSEETFQQLIETVRYAFMADRTLGAKVQWSRPMQVRTVMMAMFGTPQYLCHYTELLLPVKPNPVTF